MDLYPAFQNMMAQGAQGFASNAIPGIGPIANALAPLLKYFAPQGQNILPFANMAQKDPSRLGDAVAAGGYQMPPGFSAAAPDVGAALNGGGAPTPIPVQTTDVGPAPIEGDQTIPVGEDGERAPTSGWDPQVNPDAGQTGLGSKMAGVVGAGLKMMQPPSMPHISHQSIAQAPLTKAQAEFAPAPGDRAHIDLPSAASMPGVPHAASAHRGQANIQELLAKSLPPQSAAHAALSKLLARA